MVAPATNSYFRRVKNETPKFIQGLVVPNVGKTGKFINTLIKSKFLENKIPLSKEQFIVLLRVEDEPKQQSVLSMITERDKGSLTRLVQSLEKKRYIIRRVCSHDSRANWVEITDKGQEILNKIKPIMAGIYESIQVDISEEEKQIALKVLIKIQENAKKEFEEESRLK